MAGSSIATQVSPSVLSDRPATQDELKVNLRLLFSAFRTTDSDNSDQIAATYLLVLKQYSAQAIHAGILKLIDGRIADHDGTWLPSCAIVARAVRAEDERIKARLEITWKRRLADWREYRRWDEAWGPNPDQPNCLCPGFLLDPQYAPLDTLRLLARIGG